MALSPHIGTLPSTSMSMHNHPRRVPQDQSVCIRRSTPPRSPFSHSERGASIDLSAASNIASIGEDTATQVGFTRPPRPTGPSRNARKWFEDSNKNVVNGDHTRLFTDDPPFYLKQNKSASSDESLPVFRVQDQARPRLTIGKGSRPSTTSQLQGVDSSSQDFRSVIDDLTVENRKLKRRLKRFEQSQQSNLKDARLFEVSIYGLPPSKKRRLEKTLQEFASSLVESPGEKSPASVSYLPPAVPLQESSGAPKPSSSSTSNSRPVDSAYASMSTSGVTSIPPSRHVEDKRIRFSGYQDHQVRTYLHNVSKCLLPKNPRDMTEKAKKQLVVRRLEQIFTGKGESSNKSFQPLQQQEISQSAANADRKAIEARGCQIEGEGVREARISLPSSKLPWFRNESTSGPLESDGIRNTQAHEVVRNQRPTRPLDLDTSRAQVPAENIEYIKHLGFDSPKLDPDKAFREGEGWIYLSLLMNMAQLHTLNVTLEFVRSAILELSTKFEISHDGRNVRWKGGQEGTQMSSESGGSTGNTERSSPDDLDLSRTNTREKSSKPSTEGRSGFSGYIREPHEQSSSHLSSTFKRQPLLLSSVSIGHRCHYKPLFFHDTLSEDDLERSLYEYETLENSDSKLPVIGIGQHNTILGRLDRQLPFRTSQSKAGSVVFYSAKFFADLSKDCDLALGGGSTYPQLHGNILGRGLVEGSDKQIDPKGPLSAQTNQIRFTPVKEGNIENIKGLEPLDTTMHHTEIPVIEAIPLRASGIGGVHPSDNFLISVSVQHGVNLQQYKGQRNPYPLISKKFNLSPAALPPPSYAFLPFSSSESEAGNSDGTESSESEPEGEGLIRDTGYLVPPAFLGASSGITSLSTSQIRSDDSSIDFLAPVRMTVP